MAPGWERDVRAEYEAAIDEWMDEYDAHEVADLLDYYELGAIQELYVQDKADHLASIVAGGLLLAFLAAGRLEDPRFSVLRDPYASWLRERERMLSVELLRQAIQNLQGIVRRGLAEGASTLEIAGRIRLQLWLTPAHSAAVDALRASMKAAEVVMGVRARAIARAVARYRAYRSIQIAANEVQAAINAARMLIWRELAQAGAIPPDSRIQWYTVPDERRCEECRPYHLTTIPVGSSFPDGDPPLHPHCRCWVILLH